MKKHIVSVNVPRPGIFRSELKERAIMIADQLTLKGSKTSVEEVLLHLRRVRQGVVYLNGRYTDWHTKIRVGQINFRTPLGMPFNLILAAFDLPLSFLDSLSDRLAQSCAFVPVEYKDPVEIAVFTDEWNRQLAELRNEEYQSVFPDPDPIPNLV